MSEESQSASHEKTSRMELRCEVKERDDIPGSWGVEARRGETLVEIAVFGGPDALAKAIKYAHSKYTNVMVL